jgi:hypothetical protein
MLQGTVEAIPKPDTKTVALVPDVQIAVELALVLASIFG